MQKITIVGAGLVGSLLAAYLSKKGFLVDVFERRGDMRQKEVDGGRSINLALSNRGWKALKEIGLEEEVKQITIPMYGRMIHDLEGNQTLQPYGLSGQAIYSVSRSDINRLLMDCADALPNINFHFHQRCRKIDLDTTTLTLENEQTDELHAHQSDLIFGADGAFSNVRFSLQRTYRFNYSQSFLPHGYKELTIPASAAGEFQMEPHALHIWPRKSFMLIALPNPDRSFTCTLFLAFEGAVSFEQLQTPEQVQDFFESYFPDAIPLMPQYKEEFFENPTSSLITVKCDPWVKNKVALIGDASHAIVPFYGQGMNSGFEDCSVLNAVIDQYREGQQVDWATVLEEYQTLRIPDANAISDLALHNFIEMRNSVINPNFVYRKKIEKVLNEKYADKYLPLYSMVTFSDMRYSEALRLGKLQDDFFQALYLRDNWQEQWEKGELDEEIDTWINRELNSFTTS